MSFQLLVGIDATQMDATVMRQAAFYCRQLPVRQVLFLHVVAAEPVPESLRTAHQSLAPLPEEVARKRIEGELDAHFRPYAETPVSLSVEHGNTTEQVLLKTQDLDIRLLMLGKKLHYSGQGVSASRIANMAPCPVAFVPETAREPVDRILVPVDFSDHSAAALREALQWADAFKAQVLCHHIIGLPAVYYPYIPTDQVEPELVSHAQERFQAFLQEHELPDNLNCHFTIGRSNNPARDVYTQAQRVQADLIVVGARGRTPAASFVLGSLAENLAYGSYAIPILVHKPHEERMGLLQALRERFF